MQQHLLYVGEINSSQELAWRKSIEVFEEGCLVIASNALARPSDRDSRLLAPALAVA